MSAPLAAPHGHLARNDAERAAVAPTESKGPVPFDAEDAACQRQHHRKTSDELIELGYAPGPARGYFDVPQGARFVTLAFTPRDLFQQSPGPEAGMRLPEADWAETETNVVPLAAKARRSSAARVTAREDLMAVTQL